jgi:hypothetical protein
LPRYHAVALHGVALVEMGAIANMQQDMLLADPHFQSGFEDVPESFA